MKTLIYIMIATALFGACRSTKEKQQWHRMESQKATDSRTHHSLHAWTTLDSMGRYWQYSGDTSFYYHPEIGFFGHRGTFSFSDYSVGSSNNVSATTRQHEKDGHYQISDSLKKARSAPPHRATPWIVISISLVLLAIWIRRKQRSA